METEMEISLDNECDDRVIGGPAASLPAARPTRGEGHAGAPEIPVNIPVEPNGHAILDTA